MLPMSDSDEDAVTFLIPWYRATLWQRDQPGSVKSPVASNVCAGWVVVSVGEYDVRTSPKLTTRRRSESVTTDAAAGRPGESEFSSTGRSCSRPSSARVSTASGAPYTRSAAEAGTTVATDATPDTW